MKKILALALALVLALSLGSVAFAATTNVVFGTEVKESPENKGVYERTAAGDIVMRPGETFKFTWEGVDKDNVKDYKVTYKATKGDALIESVKLDKDGLLVLKLKENYTITDAKEIAATVTLTKKATKEEQVLTIDPTKEGWTKLYVANAIETVYGEKKKADAEDAPQVPVPADNTVYVCDEDYAGYVAFGTNANLLSVTMKMEAKEKAFMAQTENDKDIMEALEEKYPDADIEAYTFGGQPSFKNAAEFKLQADYADQYKIYAYEGGKLTAVDADWDAANGVYTWTTKAPRTYVISDVELVAAAEEEAETKNPDTGANDVVGVAAALAVVSLVAAGAVSLKK